MDCRGGLACTAWVDIEMFHPLHQTSGGTYDAGTDSCSVDITTDNAGVAFAAEQAGCEAAGGTWENDACTPVAVADRDCFREGFCGLNALNYGDYEGATISSTGCNDTAAGANSYQFGTRQFELLAYPLADYLGAGWLCGVRAPPNYPQYRSCSSSERVFDRICFGDGVPN